MPRPKYDVTTYDPKTAGFTPQAGVRRGPWTMFGLRKALRALRAMGYDVGRNAPSVLVERRT